MQTRQAITLVEDKKAKTQIKVSHFYLFLFLFLFSVFTIPAGYAAEKAPTRGTHLELDCDGYRNSGTNFRIQRGNRIVLNSDGNTQSNGNFIQAYFELDIWNHPTLPGMKLLRLYGTESGSSFPDQVYSFTDIPAPKAGVPIKARSGHSIPTVGEWGLGVDCAVIAVANTSYPTISDSSSNSDTK